ncbi:hypothetical protein ACFQGT_07875 [Natrialbaceae archaeon GCM10025810]|uniref:hypothetical protein n=1 Tax=Halovalidus salilacus TaxID=3075124 RepID=UPI00360B37CB
MADLTAFGLELRDSSEDEPAEESEPESEAIWTECLECGCAGYDVKIRSVYSVPLCPACFAEREGLK